MLPTFILSDTRKVGYAIPRVRPPVEVYGLVPITDSDGADASSSLHAGDFVNTLVGTYGKTSFRVPGGGSAEAKRSWVIADTLEYGSATLHIAYLESTLDLNVTSLDALFSALRQFGPQGTALADKYDVHKNLVQLITVGGMYDPGSWFVRGEWREETSIPHSARALPGMP